MNVARVLETKGSGEVLTLGENASLREFVARACERNVGALLVVNEKGVVCGIVTERDVLRQCNAGIDFEKTPVSQVMTRDVVSVRPGDDINKAMDLMITKSIRHLPVLEEDAVLGVITVRDVMRALRKAEEDDIRYLIQYLQESMAKENVSL